MCQPILILDRADRFESFLSDSMELGQSKHQSPLFLSLTKSEESAMVDIDEIMNASMEFVLDKYRRKLLTPVHKISLSIPFLTHNIHTIIIIE